MTREDLAELREAAAALPDTLKHAQRWLVWKSEQRGADTKPAKVPYYVNGQRRFGRLDSPTESQRLGSLDDALSAMASGNYDGLGFALGPDGERWWQGIDLDDLPQRPELNEIAVSLPGYVEISPSGKGRHAIGVGRKFDALGANNSGCEAYCENRFFTVTCKAVGRGAPECLAQYVEQRVAVAHRRIPEAHSGDDEASPVNAPTQGQIDDLRSALNHLRADDRDLWQRVGHALKTAGDVGRGLWLDWSEKSQKHRPAEDAQTWESFRPTKTDWRSVFTLAQKAGWRNPASSRADNSVQRDRSAFKLIPASELLANAAPPNWLIEGMFELATLVLFFGDSGAGKSFVAIDWACCVATGTPWHGRAVRQGPAIIVAAEGHHGIARRVKACARHHRFKMDDFLLFVSRGGASLLDGASAAAVREAVDRIAAKHGNPVLIVIDTMARNLGPGDENSNADVGRFITVLSEMCAHYGATLLIVHHSGHDNQKRARGASALRAAVDHEFQASKSGASGLITLTAHKMKEAELPPPIYLELHPIQVDTDHDGRPITSAALRVASNSICHAPIKPLTPLLQNALASFKQAAKEQGTLDTFGEFDGLHCSHWRPVFYSMSTADNESAKKKQFQRAREELRKRGELEVQDDVFRLVGPQAQAEHGPITDAIRARLDMPPLKRTEHGGTAGQNRDIRGQMSRSATPCRDGTGHTPNGVSHSPAGQTANASCSAPLNGDQSAQLDDAFPDRGEEIVL